MSEKNMSEKILDWFELNPSAKARCGPLSKALKVDQGHLATTLNNLSTRGVLGRVKVKVSKDQGGNGSEQWEYWMPIGGQVISPPAPYVPPKAFRRESPANPDGISSVEYRSAAAEIKGEADQLRINQLQAKISELEDVIRKDNDLIKAMEEAHSKLVLAADEIKVDMAQKLDDSDARVAALEAEISAQSQPVLAETGCRDPAGYVVASPNKPLRRTLLEKNALRYAMSAARSQGMAEVFEIYSVGKAIRGAEWKPKSW